MRNPWIIAALITAGIFPAVIAVAAERAAPVTEASSGGRIEERLSNLEKTLQKQGLLDLLQQIQALQAEVASLRGQLEINNHELENLKEQQRKLYTDTDLRLQKLEGRSPDATAGTVTPPLEVMTPTEPVAASGNQAESSLTVENVSPDTATAEATDTATVAVAEPPAPADNPIEAQAQYQEAFKLLKQAQYDQAITAFDKFLTQYPDNPYSDNAQHWMGEAYYVTRRYQNAITEYMKLITNYPDSQKVPNSLLKIGYSYYALGQPGEARKILEELIKNHPGTVEARNAEEKLKQSPTS